MPIIPGRREDPDADGAADVGDEAVLDHEVHGPLQARLDRRLRGPIRVRDHLTQRRGWAVGGATLGHQTIPRPPETPTVSPVT